MRSRILTIDDNPSIHEDFRKILTHKSKDDETELMLFGERNEEQLDLQFDIDSALQGKDGFELVKQAVASGQRYGLAFVDIRMPPGWDGLETITHIWKVDPELQIVICSAFSDYSWLEIKRRLGAKDNLLILKKPFDNIEVLQIAHALTKKWLLSQTLARQMQELESANARLKIQIRERMAAEALLKHSEERFAKAFKSIPVAISIQSLDTGRFLDVNQRFCELVELSKEDVLNSRLTDKEFGDFINPRQLVVSGLRDAGSIANAEYRAALPGGKEKCILLSAEVFEWSGKSLALVSELDITDRVKMERKLRQASKMEAVGQLSAGIAHDFNNVLTIVRCSSEMLLMKGNDDSKTKFLQNILAASSHASQLTKQLLAFARQQVLEFKVCDLNRVVESLSQMVARTMGASIQLHTAFTNEELRILADECSIEQVLLNLAINARDAMENGGELRIATQRLAVNLSANSHPDAVAGEFACLRIEDSGSGMTDEVKSRLFEPFFTTKQPGKGTGLGLASVYGIVRQHKGWIEVDSAPNQGTTFQLFFPLSREECSGTSKTPASDNLRGAESVLIVDDEEGLIHVVKHSLELYGYNVFTAGKCSEAMRIWDQHKDRIKLVLTDVVLPGGMSGLDLVRHFRKLDPSLKIVVTTGYSSELVSSATDLSNEFQFLPKPFSPTELAQAIRRGIDS